MNYSFNEAGAIMPRSGMMPPADPECSTWRYRFNEAGAIMPRSGEATASTFLPVSPV